MASRGFQTRVIEYPLASKGVNLHDNITKLDPQEAVLTQNMIFENGMIKRGGQSKYSSTEVSAGIPIAGLYRYLLAAGTEQVIAAAGTFVKYSTGTTWTNIKTGLTSGSRTMMVNWLGSVYIANGVDAPHKWDGSSSTALGAAPTKTIQFLPFRDRLLSIDNNDPGDLRWSGSFDDTTWEVVANVGVRPDTMLNGMVLHSSTNNNSGLQAKVLLAGDNGMYLFSGTDLRVPATTGDYAIEPLPIAVGCNAPESMVPTPIGTFWLGMDREVYLLPFNDIKPIPVGTKIRSNWGGQEGIESIPVGQIPNAAGAWHDGYYILTFTPSGETSNKTQWWLDTNRLQKDENGLFGPWYGPMIGQEISVFAGQVGLGGGELLGGSDNGTNGSYVYKLDVRDTYNDDGTAIQIYYYTFYAPTGITPEAPAYTKTIRKAEAEMKEIVGDVMVDLIDIDETILENENIGGTSTYFGSTDFGPEYFNKDSTPINGKTVYFSNDLNDPDPTTYFGGNDTYFNKTGLPVYQDFTFLSMGNARKLAALVGNIGGTDTFELYALRLEVQEQNLPFDRGG